ncbi:hypothetical protein Hanom_Chr03g00212061 [Helianthus anomalus]
MYCERVVFEDTWHRLAAESQVIWKSQGRARREVDEARSQHERAEKQQVHATATCLKQDSEIQRLTTQLSEHEELKQELASKDRDLSGKDVEIAELKCRLREFQDKSESLEIDLAAEKVCADTADDTRNVAMTTLNVVQDNSNEVQAMVANAILNSVELDETLAALTVSARSLGHQEG